MTDNSPPDWFVLIEQWVPRGMGQTGITLSFLAGALAFKRGAQSVSVADLRHLLSEIVSKPVPGFATEVRWCHNIDAPVLTVERIERVFPFKSSLPGPNGQASLGFSQDLQSSVGGLDCNSADRCLEKLIVYTAPHAASGNFSRVRDPINFELGYGAFLPNEIAYIQSTVMAPLR
jgi:hypothetical protein